jgi:hypothetical protein
MQFNYSIRAFQRYRANFLPHHHEIQTLPFQSVNWERKRKTVNEKSGYLTDSIKPIPVLLL